MRKASSSSQAQMENVTQLDRGAALCLHEVLDESVVGIIILDEQMEIVVWNRWVEEHSNISKEAALNTPLFNLFPQLQNRRIQTSVSNALYRGSSSLLSHALLSEPFPLYSRNGSGEQIRQMVYVKPLSAGGGRRYAMIQINDVSAALRREAQLKKAVKDALHAQVVAEELSALKSAFIATVSHELRTPLTSIRGSLSLLLNKVVGEVDERAGDMLEICDRNSERLLTLINDILDIEKIESGRMEFSFQPIDMGVLLERALEENSGYADQYGVAFKLEVSQRKIIVNADSERLMQVLSNLMSNAAKYEPAGGEAIISAKVNGNGKLHVAITDHGPGVPKGFCNRIFEKFSQADCADNRKPGGTGLGLAISKAIIEYHRGQIGFRSQPDNETTFYFELPIIQA